MAFQIRDCAFPNNLEASAKALQDELGARVTEILNAVPDIEALTFDSELEQGCTIIEQLLLQGDGTSSIQTCADVSTQFGLEQDQATTEQDELYLRNANLILIRGVYYVSGEKSNNPADATNIEILRRIYFATGRDLAETERVLNSGRQYYSHSQYGFIKMPIKPGPGNYSIDDVRTFTNDDVYVSDDFANLDDRSAVILSRTFLSSNNTKSDTTRRFGVADNQIGTTFIHDTEVDNSTGAINRYSANGYIGDELSAIIAGVDLVDVSTATITTQNQNTANIISNAIQQIDFINGRFSSLSASDQELFRSNISTAINTAYESHLATTAKNFFQVSVLVEKDVLTKLRKRHSDDDIKYLLERRRDVNGLWFEAPDSAFFNEFESFASPGSTALSNRFLNQPAPSGITNSTILLMAGDLILAKERINQAPLNQQQLSEVRDHLSSFLSRTLITQPTTNPPIFQGMPAMGTPTDILVRDVDTDLTFDINARLGLIDDALSKLGQLYTDDIAKPLAAIILLIVAQVNNARAAIKRVADRLRQQVLPFKQRLDTFMSRYLSLVGSGSFNSSLLKCAINFDLGLSSPLLDDLLRLIDNLEKLANAFISKLARLISDFLERVLCLPINLINAFLGGVESRLIPSACQVSRINLGTELEDALQALRNACLADNFIFDFFSRDLIRYRIIVNGATNKLNQFRTGAICSSNAASNFYNSSILNLQGGVGPSPIAGIAGSSQLAGSQFVGGF